jgi:hypothetical protein
MDLSQTKLPAEQLPQHFIAAEKQCFHTVCLNSATAQARRLSVDAPLEASLHHK